MSDLDQRIASLSPEKREMLLRKLNKQQSASSTQTSIPRRSETTQPLPLSFAQESLWLVDQIAPGSAAYIIPCVWRLQGPFNLAALEQTIQELVNRHETLRTTFLVVGGQPTQKIAPTLHAPLTVVDLQHLPEKEREQNAQQHIDAEMARPFDLAQGPLLRATLLRLTEQEHILALMIHHIVSDGWSRDVLLRELTALYSAFSAGQPSPLPELPIQYADFAIWQRERLQGEQTGRLLDYWKRRMAGASVVLELPTDHPHPAVQTFNGARIDFTVPSALAKDLRALSQQEQTTLFMTLLAAFQALLSRYTGYKDIVVGSPIANRSRTETEGLIGYLVNMLVLRADFSGDLSFRELLKQGRTTTLDAYAHQDLPFEKLVEALQPERNTSYTPLFQVLFTMENPARSQFEGGGLTWDWMETSSTSAKFDLMLGFQETQHQLSGFFEYNTDLFEAATIERMVGHFQTLLAGMVAAPDRPIVILPLLTEAERQQMLVEWNATKTPYQRDQCFHQLFEAQVVRTPDAVAVVFAGQHLTYRQLNERANQLAHHLRQLGIGPEVLVGLCMERSPEIVVGLLGILKAGGAYLPLDPGYPSERLSFMLEDAQTPVMLTQQRLLPRLPLQNTRAICLDTGWNAIAGESTENLVSGVKPENLAYVIYTSGSTGKPKGVQIEQRSLTNYLHWVVNTLMSDTVQILPAVTKLTFDASLKQLFGPLLRGGAVWLLPEDAAAQPAMLLREIRQRKNVGLNCVPSLWAALLDLIETNPSASPGESLTCLFVGGEEINQELVNKTLALLPHLHIWNLYGPTENTANAICSRLTADGPVTIGRPIANTQVYLLDTHLQPVPPGIAGEIYIGGTGLARGYLNRPELNTERFIPHPLSAEPGARLYRTGDLARYRATGEIEFLGRVDYQVKIRGFRIELGEIEAALRQHPTMRETLVVAHENTRGDKRLVAYVVPAAGEAPTSATLRAFLLERVPDYMIPSSFVILEALPLNSHGKVDRRALPAPEESRTQPGEAFVAPRTPTEEQLAAIWADLLGLNQVGITDNFFDLGGHSLLAVRLITRIEEVFGKKISLATLFAGPTIEKITDALQQQGENSSRAPIFAIQSSGSRPPLFFMHGAWEGGGFYCYRLARNLGPEQPFYALQPYRLDGLPVPPSYEQMAKEHLEAIRAIQPEGPYTLGGFCNGGLMGAEMTRQLLAQGQKVRLLIIIDPSDPARISQRLSRGAFRAIGRLFRQPEPKQLDLYLRIRTFFTYLREIGRYIQSPGYRKYWSEIRNERKLFGFAVPNLNWLSVSLDKLREEWPAVHHWITPRRISDFDADKIVVLWKDSGSDDRGKWGKLAEAKGAETYTLPGEHSEWTAENIHALADQLNACINTLEAAQITEEVLVAG